MKLGRTLLILCLSLLVLRPVAAEGKKSLFERLGARTPSPRSPMTSWTGC